MNYKEIENKLNEYNDWVVLKGSDDGRKNSQDSEEDFCKKINESFAGVLVVSSTVSNKKLIGD